MNPSTLTQQLPQLLLQLALLPLALVLLVQALALEVEWCDRGGTQMPRGLS